MVRAYLIKSHSKKNPVHWGYWTPYIRYGTPYCLTEYSQPRNPARSSSLAWIWSILSTTFRGYRGRKHHPTQPGRKAGLRCRELRWQDRRRTSETEQIVHDNLRRKNDANAERIYSLWPVWYYASIRNRDLGTYLALAQVIIEFTYSAREMLPEFVVARHEIKATLSGPCYTNVN